MLDPGSFFASRRRSPRAATVFLAAALAFGPLGARDAWADGDAQIDAARGIAAAVIIEAVIFDALEEERDRHGGRGYDRYRAPEGPWTLRGSTRSTWRGDGRRRPAAREDDDARLGAHHGDGWRALRTGDPWAGDAIR